MVVLIQCTINYSSAASEKADKLATFLLTAALLKTSNRRWILYVNVLCIFTIIGVFL
jgi:hypothetical protein